jgi:transposase InsO family protein
MSESRISETVQTTMIKRLHGTIRQRNKVMQELSDIETAQTMIDGLRIYYNFIRPHMALNGRTPAQKASVESDKAEWMSLIKKASQYQRFEISR